MDSQDDIRDLLEEISVGIKLMTGYLEILCKESLRGELPAMREVFPGMTEEKLQAKQTRNILSVGTSLIENALAMKDSLER